MHMRRSWDFTNWSLKAAVLAGVFAALSVLGHRFAIIGFQPALLGIAGSILSGLVAIVLGAIGTLQAIKAKKSDIAGTMAGSTLGLIVIMPAILAAVSGAGAPLIHDISTNLDRPPEFVAIKALRTAAHNSLDRAEPSNLMVLQQQNYPDISPLLLNRPFDQVFEQAIALVNKRGWDVVSVSAANGRIEATDTTRMMGFKDDVVILIQKEGNLTRVDMRSASRIGKGDLGVNAARIRSFLADLG